MRVVTVAGDGAELVDLADGSPGSAARPRACSGIAGATGRRQVDAGAALRRPRTWAAGGRRTAGRVPPRRRRAGPARAARTARARRRPSTRGGTPPCWPGSASRPDARRVTRPGVRARPRAAARRRGPGRARGGLVDGRQLPPADRSGGRARAWASRRAVVDPPRRPAAPASWRATPCCARSSRRRGRVTRSTAHVRLVRPTAPLPASCSVIVGLPRRRPVTDPTGVRSRRRRSPR